MKVIAYTALHYGKCYLASAIFSVIDRVDQLYVLYTDVGSHGHRADQVKCPDSEEELYAIAHAAAGKKLTWIRGRWTHEGAQRDSIEDLAPDADVIIPLDYDEIWQPGLLDKALQTALEMPQIRRWRIPFRHYWRSFYRCILHDPAYPVRLINLRATVDGEGTLDTQDMAVNHFGYAIPPTLMRYKWQLHGHKNELRTDVDYFTGIYEANRQYDCHPVGSEWWTPETVDPFGEHWLPQWMSEHPYSTMGVIE